MNNAADMKASASQRPRRFVSWANFVGLVFLWEHTALQHFRFHSFAWANFVERPSLHKETGYSLRFMLNMSTDIMLNCIPEIRLK